MMEVPLKINNSVSKGNLRVRDIRKFHVAVVQRRLRNVEKSVMHLPSRCFADKNIHTNIHKSLYQAVQTQAESFLLLL